MPGVYFHIPFCKRACTYCDFHFSTSRKHQPQVLAAMLKELEFRLSELQQEPISSIYFGGGTPSLLTSAQLNSLLTFLRNECDLSPSIEITLEANAEALQDDFLATWINAGVNRLSIGVQSFEKEVLKWMRRTHDPSDVLHGIPRATHHGFNNISIDLIYGLPNEFNAAWEDGLYRALEMDITHISSYILTTEPRTLLDAQVKRGEVTLPSDEEVEAQYNTLIRACSSKGFEHYEVSNFGKPGFHSVHNTSYWNGIPYIGIGPSAHSFDGKTRSWNIRSNARYIQEINAGRRPCEVETLSVKDRYNEYIMTKLRTREGVSLGYVLNEFKVDLQQQYGTYWHQLTREGKANSTAVSWFLNDAGLIHADAIAANLFWVN